MLGEKFNMLTVVAFVGMNAHRHKEWQCLCDCGNTCIVEQGHLRTGNTKSCGCWSKGRPKKRKQSSGKRMKDLKAYSSWCEAKKRCHSPDHHHYKNYGAKDIFMSEEFLNDSIAWCEYLGEPPDDGQRWSVDRIDGTKGYERGNIRWATPDLQARNLKKSSANTSGVVGVTWQYRNEVICAARAFWQENGRQVSKTFNIKNYASPEEAFAAATAYRQDMIDKLNEQGAGYTPYHGK